ncbi:MAG: alpha/beta hydrolase family protein [Deltaproteobacteria bacterium]|nr:alpha/beta hydrolase family protein [Deltaproteobacteria bacterium]
MKHREALPSGGSVVDLTFPSPYRPHYSPYTDEFETYKENITAHARWFRSLRPRTTMICLHGLGGGGYFLEERAFAVRSWVRMGVDVVLFQMPFHGNRRPSQAPRASVMFPTAHVVRTNEAFGQAVCDLRALIGWLKDHEVPNLGFFGMSLGAYTAALMASVQEDLDFAVPMIPAACLTELMWRNRKRATEGGAIDQIRITKEHLERVFRVHAPLCRPPRIPIDRRFLVGGRSDRVTGPEQAEALWKHWDRPEIYWIPGAHLAQVGRSDAFRALHAWLRSKGLVSGK